MVYRGKTRWLSTALSSTKELINLQVNQTTCRLLKVLKWIKMWCKMKKFKKAERSIS